MKRRIFVALVLLTAVMLKVRAQWDVQFSDYTALKSFYNPAVSGTDGMQLPRIPCRCLDMTSHHPLCILGLICLCIF